MVESSKQDLKNGARVVEGSRPYSERLVICNMKVAEIRKTEYRSLRRRSVNSRGLEDVSSGAEELKLEHRTWRRAELFEALMIVLV